MTEASRINGRVEKLENQAEYTESGPVAKILLEIEMNRRHLEKLAREVEAARPESLEEFERLTEMLGQKLVLDGLSKHLVDLLESGS